MPLLASGREASAYARAEEGCRGGTAQPSRPQDKQVESEFRDEPPFVVPKISSILRSLMTDRNTDTLACDHVRGKSDIFGYL